MTSTNSPALYPLRELPPIERPVFDEQASRKFWVQRTQDVLKQEDVSTSITQTWTDQAIKCYMLCSDCVSCSIPRGEYNFVCQMNQVVPVLLSTLGEPEPQRLERLTPYMNT